MALKPSVGATLRLTWLVAREWRMLVFPAPSRPSTSICLPCPLPCKARGSRLSQAARSLAGLRETGGGLSAPVRGEQQKPLRGEEGDDGRPGTPAGPGPTAGSGGGKRRERPRPARPAAARGPGRTEAGGGSAAPPRGPGRLRRRSPTRRPRPLPRPGPGT